MRRRKKSYGLPIVITLIIVCAVSFFFFAGGVERLKAFSADEAAGIVEVFFGKTLKGVSSEEIDDTEILWLVNAGHPVARADDVQTVSAYQTLPLSRMDITMHPDALSNAERMFSAAEADGMTGYVITSGYRSYIEQQALYDEAADKSYVQKPNCSEHQIGLALDINLMNGASDFGATEQGKWLEDNAHRFGFIVRYPEDKAEITGISYEPWHFRYVGIPHAAFMAQNGLCFEEYIDWLESNDGYTISVDGQSWRVYRTTNQDDAINVSVQRNYSVSSDNAGGFIITETTS